MTRTAIMLAALLATTTAGLLPKISLRNYGDSAFNCRAAGAIPEILDLPN